MPAKADPGTYLAFQRKCAWRVVAEDSDNEVKVEYYIVHEKRGFAGVLYNPTSSFRDCGREEKRRKSDPKSSTSAKTNTYTITNTKPLRAVDSSQPLQKPGSGKNERESTSKMRRHSYISDIC